MNLRVSAPDDMDTVQAESVEVRGTVEPAGAAVTVMGQRAPVSGGGEFTATVPLTAGANVIDVMASAPGRAAAMTAFRVTREVPVEVPDLAGQSADEVEDTLADRGLGVEIEQVGGGFLDELLPGDAGVCEQDPAPGTQVRRGTKVHVTLAKGC